MSALNDREKSGSQGHRARSSAVRSQFLLESIVPPDRRLPVNLLGCSAVLIPRCVLAQLISTIAIVGSFFRRGGNLFGYYPARKPRHWTIEASYE